MKKIIAVTQVKNESDIIESLCRYTAEYCDAILIYENDSIDSTRDIICKLIDEGLPIYLVDDIKNDFQKGKIKVPVGQKYATIQRAFDELDADIVLCFDADEFLCSTDGQNPREILENLDETVEYRVKWRGFVYQGEPTDTETFLPHRFEYYRNPKLECMTKAIMSRYLYKEKHAKLGIANHFLVYPRENLNLSDNKNILDSIDHYYKWEVRNNSVKIIFPEDLVFAHYPIRSKTQLKSKIVPNWIYQLSAADREACSLPWKKIYDYIKQYGDISEEAVIQQSLEYTIFPIEEASRMINELGDNVLIHGPLPTAFCKGDLKLKYTDYRDTEKTWIKDTLINIESAFTKLPEREAEAVYLMRETRRHNNDLTRALEAKDEVIRQRDIEIKNHNELIRQQDIEIKNRDELVRQWDIEIKNRDVLIKQLDTELNDIHRSRSWKLARVFSKIFRFLNPVKRSV